jgi:hypothetical protein
MCYKLQSILTILKNTQIIKNITDQQSAPKIKPNGIKRFTVSSYIVCYIVKYFLGLYPQTEMVLVSIYHHY